MALCSKRSAAAMKRSLGYILNPDKPEALKRECREYPSSTLWANDANFFNLFAKFAH